MSTENDQTLSEIRKLNSKFDDLALQIRIDTPWQRIRDNVRYALNIIKEIPIGSRTLIFVACGLTTAGIVINTNQDVRKKLLMFALDCLSLALVLIWT